MDLVSDHPYWAVKDGLLADYPPLTADETCDVAVLGAGISGALVAQKLTEAGLDVVVLDRRDAGQGSTAASTALLQYEIDVHLCDLIEKIGLEPARRAYRLCLDSIEQLHELSTRTPIDSAFQACRSLYVCRKTSGVRALREEFAARRAAGIEVEWLETGDVDSQFGVSFPAAILSQTAASCDAYRLTHGLLAMVRAAGSRVFDRTEVTSIEPRGNGVRLSTDRGPTVTARHVVHATGYEAQRSMWRKIVTLKSTYALVTQRLESLGQWPDDCLFWESSRPYLYFRRTSDGRLLAGGEDDDFRNPPRRDAKIGMKAKKILRRVGKMFPDQPLEVEYDWAGTFGETKDGLAYIGASPRREREWYALGFGGNGITFSVIAANILTDLIRGVPNPDAELFRFGR